CECASASLLAVRPANSHEPRASWLTPIDDGNGHPGAVLALGARRQVLTRTGEILSLVPGFIPLSTRPYSGHGFLVRRLFWTFAPGAPGAGLLAMRVIAAAALAAAGIRGIPNPASVTSAALLAVNVGTGLLLLVGFWTPIAGLLVVLLEGG